MKRLFIALPVVSDAVLNNLLDSLQKQLHYERINWVKPANLHLTLKFIGEQPDSLIPDIQALMAEVCLRHQPFSLDFNRTGIFGSSYNPRVLWLGTTADATALNLLANDLLNTLERIGFERDRQNFVPHLTLARINHLSDKPRFQRIIGNIAQQHYATLDARSMVLYESILRKEGPKYLSLSESQLKSS